ncbi:MAG TPA: hypothetical protein PK586_10140 [Casimicrobium sp.]|nr:hypothetical protein [Casimicrobium sp.]
MATDFDTWNKPNPTAAEQPAAGAPPADATPDQSRRVEYQPDIRLPDDQQGSPPRTALTQREQIEAIKRHDSNFVFLFGAAQRGKTVVSSALINFMGSVDSGGKLSSFGIKKGVDEGNALLRRIQRQFAEGVFPDRTALGTDRQPLYLNVAFSPADSKRRKLRLTFLEMPGDELRHVDSPDGGRGTLPDGIDVFFKAHNVSLSFILVTDISRAADDDLMMTSFMDYIAEQNAQFESARFLLLVTKWDEYDGDKTVAEFVRGNMPKTYAKLFHPRNSIAQFSIGVVREADGKPFIGEFDPIPAKQVLNWLYANIDGQPLYRKSLWQRLRKFI